jgi:hypothetical protein
MNKFNFIEIDKNLLPDTKGRRIDGHRFYEIEGKNYPSVTTVLNIRKSEGLKQWRNNVGNEVANWEMRRAANRGKATHTLVEEYLKGETPSERGVLPLGLFKLLKPYVDQINNVHCLETIMYSHKLTIAGQVDCVAEYNGELSVIDFKTANKAREEGWIDNYFLQTTAYAVMYEEIFKKPIKQIVVLIAAEDGTVACFKKEKKDFIEPLGKAIEDFYKILRRIKQR